MSFELDKFIISGKEIEVVDNTAREQIEGLQGNIEELQGNIERLQPKADSSLNTTSKTVVGGINELNSNLSDKILIEPHSDTVEITTLPQSASYYITNISITKSGYTPLGLFFKEASGDRWTLLLVTPYYYDNQFVFNLYNPTSSPISISNISYNVVWVKIS